ncbi:GIY-YIG nuclease family protein [Prochlorococcus sp. MIT 1341]|uniref:GIY-YIG nuclease family protein n=1 Tax=Prochlorococcus sp. MIT 1341 TaxID=3096221 RepID=UPI002A756065|nr:GIY-YIG nuclease family protein [Prochlorococcus sp. MIT 1341]
MERSRGQGELFTPWSLPIGKKPITGTNLSSEVLKAWQKSLHNHQKNLFTGNDEKGAEQRLLFTTPPTEENPFIKAAKNLNPLDLTPLPLSFWRLPEDPYKGPAIYLVMDSPKELNTPILLYVGETIAAEKRWKSDHDCKSYLASYKESLSKAKVLFNLSIRFWTDVPMSTRERRNLEQLLIKKWLPPFNKETRNIWSTPFTAESS